MGWRLPFAPVQTTKYHTAGLACNKRLRFSLTTKVDTSRHESRWVADIYRRAHSCNYSYGTRVWMRVLWHC